jgi:pyruvate carboxylase subunit B
MAGLIAPDDAYELIKALKQVLKIPVQLHTHYTSGMASMSCLKAIEAGVDIIDTALAPFALRSAQPAIEPIVVALRGTPRDTGLDLAHLFKLGQYIESIAPKYRDFLDDTRMAVIDTSVLMHQIPGGMTTNLVSQLREADALDRIDEVYNELPRVRKELGYPPLVTPTSQIVGIQAVQNVLFGRYKMISTQVKDYVYGLYGKPPAPVDPKVQKIVLNGYERGETPITCRAADVIEPELDKAKEATKDIAQDIGDVLIYALYPTTGMRFLRWKYGLETPPPEVKAKTMEDVRRENELIAKAKAGKLAEKETPPKEVTVRLLIQVGDEVYSVGGEAVDAPPPASPVVTPPPTKPVEKKAAPPPAEVTKAEGTTIVAPMPGMIISYEVKVGDEVKADDVVVTLEAMKMANAISTPIGGQVKAINFKSGDSVGKDDVLAVIG